MRISFTKWQDRPHWEFDAHRLGSDDHGLWLGMATGTRMARPGLEVVTTYDSVLLVPSNDSYIAMFMQRRAAPEDPNPPEVYVDVTTAPVTSGNRVAAVDLDLDVVRLLDGTTFVDDEDEFALHQEVYGYPGAVVTAAEQSARQLLTDVRARTEPFGSASHRWMTALTEHLRAAARHSPPTTA